MTLGELVLVALASSSQAPATGRLEVQVSGCPCLVTIDGQDAGRSDDRGDRTTTFAIAAGRHVVEVIAPAGTHRASADVVVEPGRKAFVELELPPDPRL